MKTDSKTVVVLAFQNLRTGEWREVRSKLVQYWCDIERCYCYQLRSLEGVPLCPDAQRPDLAMREGTECDLIKTWGWDDCKRLGAVRIESLDDSPMIMAPYQKMERACFKWNAFTNPAVPLTARGHAVRRKAARKIKAWIASHVPTYAIRERSNGSLVLA